MTTPSLPTEYQITLLRHGQSSGNLEERIQGQLDRPLTELGLRQAQALAAYWKKRQDAAGRPLFDQVFASHLQRARLTAQTVADALQLPLEVDPIWAERGFGGLEGITLQEVRLANAPFDFYHPYIVPGETGESNLDVYLRALHALQRLLQRPAGRYLVVSHGVFLNLLHFAIMGLTPQGNYNSPRFFFENTGFSEWSYVPERRQWRMLSFNGRPHLQESFDGRGWE